MAVTPGVWQHVRHLQKDRSFLVVSGCLWESQCRSSWLLESARQRILDPFVGLNGHASDWSFVTDKIRHTLSEYLYEKPTAARW